MSQQNIDIFTQKHCVKSVRIRTYSGPYFPTFRLNTERYSVCLRIQSGCGKMRTRMTSNTDTFLRSEDLTFVFHFQKNVALHRGVF